MSIVWDTDAIGARLAQLRGEAPSGRVFEKDGTAEDHFYNTDGVCVSCGESEPALTRCFRASAEFVTARMGAARLSQRPPNWRMVQHIEGRLASGKPLFEESALYRWVESRTYTFGRVGR